MSFFLLKS